jgi:hypothetical protein
MAFRLGHCGVGVGVGGVTVPWVIDVQSCEVGGRGGQPRRQSACAVCIGATLCGCPSIQIPAARLNPGENCGALQRAAWTAGQLWRASAASHPLQQAGRRRPADGEFHARQVGVAALSVFWVHQHPQPCLPQVAGPAVLAPKVCGGQSMQRLGAARAQHQAGKPQCTTH